MSSDAFSHARFALRPRRFGLLDLFGLARQRRRLEELDDAALRDIGVTRSDAFEEARRKVWDVPGHWLR